MTTQLARRARRCHRSRLRRCRQLCTSCRCVVAADLESSQDRGASHARMAQVNQNVPTSGSLCRRCARSTLAIRRPIALRCLATQPLRLPFRLSIPCHTLRCSAWTTRLQHAKEGQGSCLCNNTFWSLPLSKEIHPPDGGSSRSTHLLSITDAVMSFGCGSPLSPCLARPLLVSMLSTQASF